jgi:RNA polymerase sigma factor (sigma-70 family)
MCSGRIAIVSDESWPDFLNLLDDDPDAAFAAFYKFAFRVLMAVPPRPMRSLGPEDRQDLIHEIVYHCVKNDFRVLRRYTDQGKPFAAWLYATSYHKSLDYLRHRDSQPETVSIHRDPDGKGLENVLFDPAGANGERLEFGEILAIVKRSMERLGEHCRLLLEMAADEFTPREMVRVLGLRAQDNKKISDDLRYCREKLKRYLAEAGIDIGTLIRG